jgi:hypothetical protein
MHRCTVILVLILEFQFTTYLGEVFLYLIAAYRGKAEKGGKEEKSEESEIKKGGKDTGRKILYTCTPVLVFFITIYRA